MERAAERVRAVVFGRITLVTVLALWAVGIAGFATLWAGVLPTPLAAAYDLVFVKLLNLPGLLLFSALLPASVLESPLGLFLVVTFGYVLVALVVSTSYHALRAVRGAPSGAG